MQAASKAKVKLAVSAKMGKVTHKQLLEYLAPLLAGDAFLDNAALLQTVAVAVRAMDPDVIARHNLHLSAEKMLLAVAAEDDCEGLLTHLTDLVPVARREGNADADDEDRATLNFAELQSLATTAYSLGLPDFDPADEAQFCKVLENFTGGSGAAVAKLLEQLARIRPVRDDFHVFNDLISPTTLEYEPLYVKKTTVTPLPFWTMPPPPFLDHAEPGPAGFHTAAAVGPRHVSVAMCSLAAIHSSCGGASHPVPTAITDAAAVWLCPGDEHPVFFFNRLAALL